MTTESTVTVSIGRNINGSPMNDEQWAAFQAFTVRVLTEAQANVLFVGQGQGFWQGQPEGDSLTAMAIVGDAALIGVRTRLAAACRLWKQEAIGFLAVPADSSLITP
jgi:hypothetical protein